jgi:hypothetical protein
VIDQAFMQELEILSRSLSYRRKVSRLIDVVQSPKEALVVDLKALVSAVLLVEMHQRPGFIRAIEWAASSLIPTYVRSVTRGPLQIAHGPWKFEAALVFASEALNQAVTGADTQHAAFQSAAQVWNGEAEQLPGSRYGYGDVLEDAYVIATRAVSEAIAERRMHFNRLLPATSVATTVR